MHDIFYIILTLIVCVLILLIIKPKNKNEQAVADEPSYVPGFLEKKPIEKKLRRVSDITTEMLRDERNLNNQLKRLMWSKEYIELFKSKLEPINIRLSIKQTKP